VLRIALIATLAALALPASASAGTLVDLSVSGGFIGGVTTTSIDRDGRGAQVDRVRNKTSFTIPKGPLADLRSTLGAAGFATLGQYPGPPAGVDTIQTRITYGGTTIDASEAPPKRLRRAVDATAIAGGRGADVLHFVDGTDPDNPVYLVIHRTNEDRYSKPDLKIVLSALRRKPLDRRLSDPDARTRYVRLTAGFVTVTARSFDRLPIGARARASLGRVIARG
jgi:hypothetical protein